MGSGGLVRTRYERAAKAYPLARSVYRLLPHACVRIPSLQLRQAYVPGAYVAYAARGPPRSSIRGAQTRLDKREPRPQRYYSARTSRFVGTNVARQELTGMPRSPSGFLTATASCLLCQTFSHVNRLYQVCSSSRACQTSARDPLSLMVISKVMRKSIDN